MKTNTFLRGLAIVLVIVAIVMAFKVYGAELNKSTLIAFNTLGPKGTPQGVKQLTKVEDGNISCYIYLAGSSNPTMSCVKVK